VKLQQAKSILKIRIGRHILLRATDLVLAMYEHIPCEYIEETLFLTHMCMVC